MIYCLSNVLPVSKNNTFDDVDNTTDLLTIASHGLSNDDRLKIDGTVIPAGLDNTIRYFVISSLTNTFQISLTSGGAAVDFTSNGDNVHYTRSDGTNFDQLIEFKFIKKIGEQSTWNGVEQYVYCLYNAVAAPGNGWTDVTTTYDGRYINVGSSTPTESDGDVTLKTAINLINLSSTANAYVGGANGAYSHDEDTGTAMTGSTSWSGGSPGSTTITSTHTFLTKRKVTTIKYQVAASASGSGSKIGRAHV